VLIADDDVDATAHRLVESALAAGSRDNVTAVVCDVEFGAPGAERPVWAGAAAMRFTEDLAG
jgi:protein phosphatase